MRTYNLSVDEADDHALKPLLSESGPSESSAAGPSGNSAANSSRNEVSAGNFTRDANGVIRPNLTLDEAIRILQRNERGRQARHRFRVIRDIRYVKFCFREKKKATSIGISQASRFDSFDFNGGEEEIPNRMHPDEAATKIHRVFAYKKNLIGIT